MKIIKVIVLFFFINATTYAQDTILIQNVNVWDGMSNALKMNYQVLIEGNLVKAVEPKVDVPKNATVIDGKGKTLIPGLSDAHVHLAMTMGVKALRNDADWSYTSIRSVKAAENFLQLGFTTVRDLGGPVLV